MGKRVITVAISLVAALAVALALSPASGAALPGVSVTNPVDFGPVTIGGQADRAATITNTSGVVLTFSLSGIFAGSGPGTISYAPTTTTCVGTLAPGASCQDFLRFTPSGPGLSTAPYQVTFTAPGGTPVTGNSTLQGTGTAPLVVLDTTPPTSTSSQTATFAWHTIPGGLRTECSLDGAPFVACSSSRTYHGLAAGSHVLQVRAVSGGIPSSSSASWSWLIIGPGAPETIFDITPSSSTSRVATLAWHSTQPGSRFECSFDGGGFAPCSSSRTYHGLARGTHTLSVRAVNFAGETDATPATATWTIT